MSILEEVRVEENICQREETHEQQQKEKRVASKREPGSKCSE